MRLIALAVAVVLAGGCAHKHERREAAAHIVARVMIAALAPDSYGDWAYEWGPVSARVSRHMHWHLFGPDPRELEEGAVARRNGWISARGQSVGISAFGNRENVTHITLEIRDGQALAVLDALRAAGADVSFVADWEESSDYVVRAPGRDAAELTSARICTPEGSRAARRCHNLLTLTFDQR